MADQAEQRTPAAATSDGDTPTGNRWYRDVRRFTLELVRIESVSPTARENDVAAKVIALLTEGGLAGVYDGIGEDALPHDEPYQRHNAYAWLRASNGSARTVVLLGHFDTVELDPYQQLKQYALKPEPDDEDDPDAKGETLRGHLAELAGIAPEIAEQVPELADRARDNDAQRPDAGNGRLDWMFGRGVGDMKSGVALNIAVMRALARLKRDGKLNISAVLLATPDEEVDSAGALQAVRFLNALREREHLEYAGCINTDYTTALYPGDEHRYAYVGTVGKLLPSFLVVGRSSHAGDPFAGLEANLLAAELIRTLSLNPALCDVAEGLDPAGPRQVTAPPVTLHAQDLKETYNTEIPFEAYFYLNVLTFTTTPAMLMEKLCWLADEALRSALRRMDDAERAWARSTRDPARRTALGTRAGRVYTYQQLWQRALERSRKEHRDDAEATLAAAAARRWEELRSEGSKQMPAWDVRRRGLEFVRWLWQKSGTLGPAVVIFYAPPYYPHNLMRAEEPLRRALDAVVARHPDLKLQVDGYFPLLSDMSYLRLDLADPDREIAALAANMPAWLQGEYRLPVEEIKALRLPCINLGPYGFGAHQAGERVLKSYSFGTLPQLVWEVIEHLAASPEGFGEAPR